MDETTNDLKIIIDKYYQTELKKLEKYFNKFKYEYEKHNFPDVASELYIHTIENIEKLAPIIRQGNYHYYATKYIFNQRMWKNSTYKKNTLIKGGGDDELANLNIMADNEFESEEDLFAKEMDMDTKLAKIKYVYEKLPLHEKILFDKYYNRGMSMRKIGNEIGVTQTAIYYMIKKIRYTIRNCKL